MAIDVFMSVGRTSTSAQEAFVSALSVYMKQQGLNPRTIGRTDFSASRPLRLMKELMLQCAGTIVIAYERIYIQDGFEQRGSRFEKRLYRESMPTVWNQIEAAMAYVLDQPLLVLAEPSMRQEGLLEAHYDWHMQQVDLTLAAIESPRFIAVFADWKKHVEAFNRMKEGKNDQND